MTAPRLWSAYFQDAHSPRAEYSAYSGRVSCSLTSATWIVSTPTGLRPAPPLSAQLRTLWSCGVPVSKRHRRQTSRLPPGSVAVKLPPGVLENAGGFGVFGKSALALWGQRGAGLYQGDGLLVNAKEDRRRASDVCLLVRIAQARMP